MRNLKEISTAEAGMTLVEIMVSLSIMLTISVILYLSFVQGTKYYALGQRKAAVVQSARGAMELLSQSLREAKSFSAATASSVTFIQVDYDTNADNVNDTVRFYLQAVGGVNRLRKDVNSALQRYLTDADENVSSLVFDYYSTDTALDTDADGLATAVEIDAHGNANSVLDGGELTSINYITITLTLAKIQAGGSSNVTLTTSVYVRNIR